MQASTQNGKSQKTMNWSKHKSNKLCKKLTHVFEGDQLRQCNDLLSKMISLILETLGPVFHIFSLK